MNNQKKKTAAPLRWLKRMFRGGSKEVNDMNIEEIESPTKKVVNEFFSRKLAVFAVVVLICMFALSFIGPLFIPLDVNYTENLLQNVKPGFDMMSVPSGMKDKIEDISSYSSFTVGLSTEGKVTVWGNTKISTLGLDMKDIPSEIKDANIKFIAAGFDHAIAIDENGKVYGWGSNMLGQYGDEHPDKETPPPDIIVNGNLDINNIKKLVCGYQVTAILMKDGTAYMWGNSNSCANLKSLTTKSDIADVVFADSYGILIFNDGTYSTGNEKRIEVANGDQSKKMGAYIGSRKVVGLAATKNTVCFMLDDHELVFSGNFSFDEHKTPELAEGEYFTSVGGGALHYSGLTNLGNVYSWGGDYQGQTNVPKKAAGADEVIVCSFQNYTVKDNALTAKWGLSGYLMGTSGSGADVFARVIHGGKMTMTIGAVSVIISTIIAIIVGCISGYFGGWVDILLMRITEIVAAIPFLPFALILSAVLKNTPISENLRIFIIMVILGVLSWTGLARLIRAQILAEREKEFVVAAKAMGVKESKIAFKHILPNVISVVLVTVTLDFASCMLTESSLSYLGFGVQLPKPTWGNMLNGANNSIIIQNFWWQWVFPSLFLGICVICINIIGDTLRDVLDPKSVEK